MSDLTDAIGSPIAMAQAFMTGFQLRGEAEGWPETTMSEIANVIETLEFQMAAARRVANPDEMVERAMRKAEQMGWPDDMTTEEVEQSVRGLVQAALGIEDTE